MFPEKDSVFPSILLKLTILQIRYEETFSFLLTFFHQQILREGIFGTASPLIPEFTIR